MLFEKIVFGPIVSRRLGISLGINLLPKKWKVCSMDCIYCECGWTATKNKDIKLYDKELIINELQSEFAKLHKKGLKLDSITYSGNGEPTLHPDFEEITDNLIALRKQYFPTAQITCLSNSTQLHRESVVRALQKIDNPMMKLDAGTQAMFDKINQPCGVQNIDFICEKLHSFGGKLAIQTLFLKGILHSGETVDNTTEAEIAAWIERLKYIRPHTVYLYPIDRPTPAKNLQKIPTEQLTQIAQKLETFIPKIYAC
jgi:wyosine [tRNA(Phe)-imidazoG37] synthetase (radical SAM superfamily)